MAAHVRIVEILEAGRRELRRRARAKGAPARVVERARIVLLAGEGVPGKQIAARVGCAEPTVVTWRRRSTDPGPPGLGGRRRPGPRAPAPHAARAPPRLARAAVRSAAGSGAGADADRAAHRLRGDALVLPAAGHRAGRG